MITHCLSTLNPTALLSFSPQPPSSMTRWSAAGGSAWPSRWPKTASTKAATARQPASWRWTSSNCCEIVNMRWGKQVSNQGGEMTGNYRQGDGVLARPPACPPTPCWTWRETEEIREIVETWGPSWAPAARGNGSYHFRISRTVIFRPSLSCSLACTGIRLFTLTTF